jgi:hypothetical protein
MVCVQFSSSRILLLIRYSGQANRNKPRVMYAYADSGYFSYMRTPFVPFLRKTGRKPLAFNALLF